MNHFPKRSRSAVFANFFLSANITQAGPGICGTYPCELPHQFQPAGSCRSAALWKEIAVSLGQTPISFSRMLRSQLIHHSACLGPVGVLKNAPCGLGDCLWSAPSSM